jgi:hypothetical protein
MVTLADKGLAGREFDALVVGELGVTLARPARAGPYRLGWVGGSGSGWGDLRHLKDQLGLERHGAHTLQGLWIRAAQRLLALAAGV